MQGVRKTYKESEKDLPPDPKPRMASSILIDATIRNKYMLYRLLCELKEWFSLSTGALYATQVQADLIQSPLAMTHCLRPHQPQNNRLEKVSISRFGNEETIYCLNGPQWLDPFEINI